ncbi:glycoside hydrolase family 78 protein [Galbibacter sp.]|uniref:glycoside hydrolase family 78 protein n=1 Tax=Galbibacter sp. TaxID=2918471 RepID=UPI003A95D20C
MRFTHYFLFVFGILLLCSCQGESSQTKGAVSVTNMQLGFNNQAVGVATSDVKFGWQLLSSLSDVRQQAYQIVISESEDFEKDKLWDSGKIDSDQSRLVAYKGPELVNANDYYWRVKVWTSKTPEGHWSESAHFYTAPNTKQLNGQWIGAIRREHSHLPKGRKMHTATFKKSKRDSIVAAVDPLAWRSIMLRKEFKSEKKLTSAKVYVSGLGHYKLSINSEPIGQSEFAPLWSDYDKTVYYNIYDVTRQLKQGDNAIGVLLGNGMYNVIGGRYSKFFVSFGPPTLYFQLELQYEDGSTQTIHSDSSWKYAKSPIVFNTLFGGEDYDARLEQSGWDAPGFDQMQWNEVVVQDAPKGKLTAQSAPSVKVIDTFGVKEVKTINDSTYVLDMGQNLSGFPEFKAKGKKGQKIRIWAGEKLKDDGQISQGGSGKPYYFEYTFKGDSVVYWKPNFSYYGYQYLQIENANYKEDKIKDLPTVLEINSLFVSNSTAVAGTFSCSNEIFNKAHHLINAAVKSNFHAVFTDCPHREKLGWLEETHLNGPGLVYNYHLEGFIPKVMKDISDAQRDSGLIPNIAPEYISFGGDFTDSPEWGMAGVMLPWMYYNNYGDSSLITQYYSVMKDYVDYLSTTAEDNIVSHGLGDWYDYGEHAAGYSKNSPIALSATSHYFYGVTLVARAAKLLEKSEDAQKYEKLAEQIRTSFNKKFYHSDKGFYGTGSQFSNAVPLFMDIVEPQEKERVLQSLIDTIAGNNYRLTTGDVGNRYLFQALAQNGKNEVMYKMQNHYDTPGYGFQIQFGLTTLTEQWDPRKGNSLNHFMMGQIEEWFYKSLAGITYDPENPGYKHFFLQPELVGDMEFVNASYESIYGTIVSSWQRNDNRVIFEFSIPANSSATVKLPLVNFSKLKVNDKQWTRYKADEAKTILELGSGNYKVEVTL